MKFFKRRKPISLPRDNAELSDDDLDRLLNDVVLQPPPIPKQTVEKNINITVKKEDNVLMPVPLNGEPTLDPVRFFEGELREMILNKDGRRCTVCKTTERLQIDHIIPHSQRGRTVLENGQTLCYWCNKSKGVQRQSEWELTKAYKKRLHLRPQFDQAFRKNEGKITVKRWKRYGNHMLYFYDGNEKVGEYNVLKDVKKIYVECWEQDIMVQINFYKNKSA